MKSSVGYTSDSGRVAGPRLRCFLRAGSLFLVVIGSSSVMKVYAATCPALTEMNLSHIQGTVYGPSGVPVPQIVIQALRDGTVLATTHTDDKGRFAFKADPGNYDLHIQ